MEKQDGMQITFRISFDYDLIIFVPVCKRNRQYHPGLANNEWSLASFLPKQYKTTHI